MTSRTTIVPVIGGGPAGMSCALWLHNYGLRPIIIEQQAELGGMARRSPYPNDGLLGRPGETARENAEAFGRHIALTSVETWLAACPQRLSRTRDGSFEVEATIAAATASAVTRSLRASAIVIATGTRFGGEEWIERIPNARQLAQRGRVHVGAPWAGEPDSKLGSHVAVIGGGDNAFDVSRMLVEKGVRASIIMRSAAPRAQPLLVRRLLQPQTSGMVDIRAPRTVVALEEARGKVRLRLDDGDEIDVDHVVLLFGYRPNTDMHWMAEIGIERDSCGYLIVDANMETSCAGVFAVGDVANPKHPCVATAIGAGTKAARTIATRLAQRGAAEGMERR